MRSRAWPSGSTLQSACSGIILGALMLWRAPALTDILSVMIGLLVLVDSVFKLQVAVDSRRMGAHSWWVTLVCTVVCLVLGILLVFNPFDGKQVLTIMMGVSLIVDGVQNLWHRRVCRHVCQGREKRRARLCGQRHRHRNDR